MQSNQQSNQQHGKQSGLQTAELKGVRALRLILGDQLSSYHSWYAPAADTHGEAPGDNSTGKPDPEILYVMMEILPETNYTLHHIQKLLAVFGAMRNFASWLRDQGERVVYLGINDTENQQSFAENLRHIAELSGARVLEYQEPDEYRLQQQLQHEFAELPLEVLRVSTEHFLSAEEDFKVKDAGSADARAPIMESFYRHMRRKHNVLMEPSSESKGAAQPLGGRWNFDSENRKPWRGDPAAPPPPQWPDQDALLHAVQADIQAAGIRSFGSVEIEGFVWPLSRENALTALKDFVKHRLEHFGPYEDALSAKEPFLFHSLLSFALNVKLLHPREVIDAAVQAFMASQGRISEASVEGFVRQILGWREYMRRYYHWAMPEFKQHNVLSAERSLPSWYWTGECSMNCMAKTIDASLQNAYAHHIQRLMVTGNFALIAGIHPDELDEWYLGIYIDAFEWVEITNTRGMSQYADGGGIATKPYAAAGAYMNRMSDYCRSCSYDPKKRTGEKACPLNALYWDFIARHHERWKHNARMAMPLRTWERFSSEEQAAIQAQARQHLDHMEDL
ncbi:MAG: cryptochrome/photolyase family protein [Spirochaetia bacterium]